MDKPKETVKVEENDYFRILIAALILLFTLVLFAIYNRKKQARRGVLLTGLCDSGKTLLFGRLVQNKFVNTQTSIKENIGDYVVKEGLLRIIDIPGHERLRDKFFESYKNLTRGIVYVIDSQTIQKDIKDVAEFLYNILSDSTILANIPSILVMCNKQDQTYVKSCNAIKSMLEKEMNTLRITKTSQLESVDPQSKKPMNLGNENETFTFDSLSQYKIDFIEGFATDKDQECNISDVQKWLLKIM